MSCLKALFAFFFEFELACLSLSVFVVPYFIKYFIFEIYEKFRRSKGGRLEVPSIDIMFKSDNTFISFKKAYFLFEMH